MSLPEGTVIEVRGLSKRYGSKLAVDQLDLDVPSGAIFGLLGPNGAGKTTTFGVISGVLLPTSGRVTVLGRPVDQLHTLRGRVAVLPQDAWFPAVVPIRTQLAHYGRIMGMDGGAAAREADRVLELVGLSESRNLKGSELSHGMTKRVGIAAALIGRPEVLLLDEPTTGLDPRSAFHIKELIGSLRGTATILLSSHQLADVEAVCTHGAILDRGKLVKTGTIHSLTNQGHEIWIEVPAEAGVELADLRSALGESCTADRPSPDRLRISHGNGRVSTDVIAAALTHLLGQGVPILGLQRGTSLEKTFMQVTAPADWQQSKG